MSASSEGADMAPSRLPPGWDQARWEQFGMFWRGERQVILDRIAAGETELEALRQYFNDSVCLQHSIMWSAGIKVEAEDVLRLPDVPAPA